MFLEDAPHPFRRFRTCDVHPGENFTGREKGIAFGDITHLRRRRTGSTVLAFVRATIPVHRGGRHRPGLGLLSGRHAAVPSSHWRRGLRPLCHRLFRATGGLGKNMVYRHVENPLVGVLGSPACNQMLAEDPGTPWFPAHIWPATRPASGESSASDYSRFGDFRQVTQFRTLCPRSVVVSVPRICPTVIESAAMFVGKCWAWTIDQVRFEARKSPPTR